MPFMQWISGEPECGLVGTPEYGTHGLTCYYPGNCHLILSVPHGGEMRPPFIEDRKRPPSGQTKRQQQKVASKEPDNEAEKKEVNEEENNIVKEKSTNKCDGEKRTDSDDKRGINDKKEEQEDPDENTNNRVTFAADIYTQEMALVAAKEYCRLTGLRPHLIMSNLHRSKLDPNRPLETAAEDPLGQQVYAEYHAFLEVARTEVGRGLLIDLHGQNHQQNSIELGYLYKRAELNSGDFCSTVPSVAALLKRTGLSPQEVVRGPGSLGALLEEQGHRAVPSPRQPGPGQQRYYRGGYISQTHGSSAGGQVDAIQVEVPAEIRHEGGEEVRSKFARDLARVLATYIDLHYGPPIHFSV